MFESLKGKDPKVGFIAFFSSILCWQIVYNIGIGFTYDSARYLFFASQFEDFGNTFTAPYAPLLPFLLGSLQSIGCSADGAIFVVFSTCLTVITVGLLHICRTLKVPYEFFVVCALSMVCSEHMLMLLTRVLTELGFATLLTLAIVGALRTWNQQRISKILVLACMLLPLQRFIGVVSSNVILFLTVLLMEGTVVAKLQSYVRRALVINIPFGIFAVTNWIACGSFLGVRKANETDTYLSNTQLMFDVLTSDFGYEMIILLAVVVLVIVQVWKGVSKKDYQSSLTLENKVLFLSVCMLMVHLVAQIHASTSVIINPINPRYIIPFTPVFAIQFIVLAKWCQTHLESKFKSPLVFCAAGILLLYPLYTGYQFVGAMDPGFNSRRLGHKYDINLNRIVEYLAESDDAKDIVFYEQGRAHLAFSYLEMGHFDILSPGCRGARTLLRYGAHYTPNLIAVPDCPDGVTSNVRYSIPKTIQVTPKTTHVLLSKWSLSKDAREEASLDLLSKQFEIVKQNKLFILFER